MAGKSALDRLAVVGLGSADAESVSAFVIPDGYLHPDADAICPRCLSWIEEWQFVRRTAYGPLQHEVCPEPLPT